LSVEYKKYSLQTDKVNMNSFNFKGLSILIGFLVFKNYLELSVAELRCTLERC